MARYSDIVRGPELKAAYDRLLLWQAKTKAEKQTAYTAAKQGTRIEVARVSAWLQPFGAPSTVMLQLKAPEQAPTNGTAQALVAAIKTGDRVKYTQPTTAGLTILKIPKAKLAKVFLTERTVTATTESASRITGDMYKHHTTDSVSARFGQSSATDSYADATAAMRAVAAVKTITDKVGCSIRFVPQATVF